MRKQDYRRAVRQISWSEEKRRSIEEQLAKPASGRQRKPVPAWEAERKAYMKEERRYTRRLLLILAAAMLAIGGTAAAIAWNYKKEHSGDEHLNSSQTEQESTDFSPHLTDQTDSPYMRTISSNGSGFFWLGGMDFTSGEELEALRIGNTNTYERAMKYYDTGSGKTVFLCAKPSCLHDRNEFCTATTKNYSIISQPVWLDGYVWAIALDNRELLKNPEGCTAFPTVLLRYAPDGTEVTEAAQIYLADTQYDIMNADLAAHRGQLWIGCTYRHIIMAEDANMNVTSSDQRGGMGFWCYEPEAKKLTELCSSGGLLKDYRPNNYNKRGFEMRGYGDYVYFHKLKEEWRDPFKGAGIFRIDCRTGKIEQVTKIRTEKGCLYAVCGDLIYYTLSGKSSNTDYIDPESMIRVYNMQTGEDTELISLFDTAKAHFPWLEKDMISSSYRDKAILHMTNLIAENDRLYLYWWTIDQRTKDTVSSSLATEFDSSGRLLKTVDLNECKGTKHTEEWIRSYLMKYGYAYQDIIYIAPEDITDFDIMFIRSNGYYETKDGELIDPRLLRNEDISKLEETGFWRLDYGNIPPEELTEEKIQSIIRDYPLDTFTCSESEYDGSRFYLKSENALYCITPEELFGEMKAERLLYY